MDTTQDEPPPPVATQSKNPFLNMVEESVPEEDARGDSMLVDPLTSKEETNPFRKLSEMQAVSGQEKEDQEMSS
jgi:hypothetical protein